MTWTGRPELSSNVLLVDIAYLERALFTTGERGPMQDRKTGRARIPEALLSLSGLLHSFGIEPPCVLHNAGNDAFMTLTVFQRMVDPRRAVTLDADVVNAMRTGNEKGKGKGGAPNGNGHVRRAATVAARLFRPLGNTQPNLGKNGNGNGEPPQTRVGRRGGDGADEMGQILRKRASMFSTLAMTSPPLVPADKNKKGASKGSAGGSGGWLSPSTTVASQRRHSGIEKLRR